MNTAAVADQAPKQFANAEERGLEAGKRLRSHAAPRLAHNALALAGGQVVTWTMTLVWTIIVPRVLGPHGLGLVVSALSVGGILGIVLGLGMRNYLAREMVVDPPAAPRLVGTAILLRLAIAPLVAVAAVLYARLAHSGHEATIVLYLAAAYTFLTLLGDPLQAAFQAVERMKYLAYSDVINKSAQSLMGIALALLGFGAIGVTADMAVAAGAVFLLNLFWLRPFVRVKLRTTVRWMIIMMRESAAYWAFGVFGMVYMWIDTLMLSLMTRPEVVGWYGAPTKIFQTLMFLPVLVSTAYLPRLVGAFQKGRSQLLRAAQTPLQLVLVVSLPICAVTAIAAHPFFNFLLGPAYAHAVPVMVILALCIPPIYLNIMLAQVLLAEKRQITWTVVMAGAAVLNPLINLVLIPAAEHRYANGAIGAAVSLLLTELLMTAVGLILVGRGAFDRKGLRRCLLVLAASVAMVCVARATVSLGTPASLAAGCATFLVLSVAFRVATPDEIAALRAGLPRFRSRQAT